MDDWRYKPSTTVAAIIEREGRFLLVEENTPEGLRLNNPAGHLDPGESLVQACARETLDETAFAFAPEALVGIYLARVQMPDGPGRPGGADISYMRFAFCGVLGALDAQRKLDTGIVRTLWLTPDEVRASAALHRSPLVLQCMEDYLAGRRYPMDALQTHASVFTSRPRA
jgi:ADP-ribose pyrophosphatase YjhB (NUDIX family)